MRNAVVALALGIATTMLATPAPAQARAEYVSLAEYRAVQLEMTRARVHRIFGTEGRVVLAAGGGHPYESRHYRARWNGKKRCVAADYERRANGRWYLVGLSKFPRYEGRCS